MSDLAGKRALVTGSSRGIGLAIAARLKAEGCIVSVNGRNEGKLADAATHLGAGVHAIAGDVANPDEARSVIAQAVTSMDGLDILVCNVGSGSSVPPGTETFAEWQRVFGINLWSTTNAVEAAKNTLAESKGVIVCISSICGVETIPGAPVTYSVAKAALNAYVRGSARPLGKLGVRINAIAPGNILFEGSVWHRKVGEDADAVRAMLERDVSTAQLGNPEDVAALVAYLASDRAKFASGAIWTLDGGQVRS